MKNKPNLKLLIITACCLSQGLQGHAQVTNISQQKLANTVKIDDIQQELKLDPDVRKGRLKNGFTYYIRQNKEKLGSANFTLVNKVGSVNEKEHERGLAHFVEHMAFNGTKNFPGNGIIDYLQKQGVRFGFDLNAYTTFEETIYAFPLSTDKQEVVERGVQIIRDWAGELLFDQAEIDAERGVILEEKRATYDVGHRIMEQVLPVSTNNSIFASRIPIGTEEVLKGFTRKDIVNFYETWYRPDRQAIIVVGDVDVDEIENLIKAKFSDFLVKTKNAVVERPAIDLVGNKKFLIVTDKEISSENIQVGIKSRGYVVNSLANYRKATMESLWIHMLRTRFMEISNTNTDAAYNSVSMYMEDAVGDMKVTKFTLSPKEGQLRESVIAGWKELLRLKQFGVTEEEFNIAKDQIKTNYERRISEAAKKPSMIFTESYKLDFLKNQVAMSDFDEQQVLFQVLQTISPQDMNAEIGKWLKDEDWEIVITAPEKNKNNLPDKTQFLGWLDEAARSELTAFKMEAAVTQLMDPDTIVAGKIKSRRDIPELGIIELQFSNGTKVVLKPTSHHKDEIIIGAVSQGGLSMISDAEYKAAKYVDSYHSTSGIGNISYPALIRMQLNNKFNMGTYIQEYEEGMWGSSGRASLEQALQLLYLRFTAPQLDKNNFEKGMENLRTAIRDQYKVPGKVLSDSLSLILTNKNPRRLPMTVSDVDKFEYETFKRIYRDRFADAADFTFFLVGDFQVDSISNVLAKYVGSLPSQGKKETYKDAAIDWHKGALTKKVYAGHEDKAIVLLYFGDTFQDTPQERVHLGSLENALQAKILDRLRNKESGVYSPSVSMTLVTVPKERITLSINFVCAPDQVDHLVHAAKEEIKLLQNSALETEIVEKFKSERRVILKDVDKNNSYWIGAISQKYIYNKPLPNSEEEHKILSQLSGNDVQKAALKYLPLSELKQFVLLPTNK